MAACCGLLAAGCDRNRPGRAPSKPSGRRAPASRPAPTTPPATTRPAPEAVPATRPAGAATQPATAPHDAGQLAAAMGRIAELQRQGEFTEAWKAALEARTRFAGHPNLDALAKAMGRLRTEKRQAAQLSNAIRLLGSDAVEAVQIAASELVDGGRVGRILLRKVVRTGAERPAVAAVGILARAADPNAPAVFWRKLQARPSAPLRAALLAGLRELAGHIPGEVLAEVYHAAIDGEFAERKGLIAVLAAAFLSGAGADPERFGRLVGTPDAHAKLKAKVAAALEANDETLAAEAAGVLADLGVLLHGLRGSYYDGRDFKKLLFERLDPQIDIANGKLPYPDGRQEDRSIRWAGQVRIAVPGEYTFYAAADDGVRLWVADKKLVDAWSEQAITEHKGTITLSKGLHPMKLEYYQGQGDCGVRLSFKGPGIDKQLLTGRHVVAIPWKPALAGEQGKRR